MRARRSCPVVPKGPASDPGGRVRPFDPCRLQRLFMTLAVDFPSQESLVEIYGTFLRGHLQYFADPIKGIEDKLVGAALSLHEKVSQTFRKTAVKCVG